MENETDRSYKIKNIKYYNLFRKENSLRIELLSIGTSGCGLSFILFFSIVIFSIPMITIILLFFDKFDFALGLLITWIISWIVSLYLAKLYLWNKYGKEIFIINENSLETYIDYKYFKDAHKKYNSKVKEILFLHESGISINSTNLSSTHEFTNWETVSPLCFELASEIIESHRKIPIPEIINIAKVITEK